MTERQLAMLRDLVGRALRATVGLPLPLLREIRAEQNLHRDETEFEFRLENDVQPPTYRLDRENGLTRNDELLPNPAPLAAVRVVMRRADRWYYLDDYGPGNPINFGAMIRTMTQLWIEEGERYMTDEIIRAERQRQIQDTNFLTGRYWTPEDRERLERRARQEAADWADRARLRLNRIEQIRQNERLRENMYRAMQEVLRQPLYDWMADGPVFRAPPAMESGARDAARKKGMQLLWRHLTPEQRNSMLTRGFFEVKGGTSGDVYSVYFGTHGNVIRRKKVRAPTSTFGRGWSYGRFDFGEQPLGPSYEDRGLCVTLRGGLVAGDVMLSQKLGFELEEMDILNVCNPYPLIRSQAEHYARGNIRAWEPYIRDMDIKP